MTIFITARLSRSPAGAKRIARTILGHRRNLFPLRNTVTFFKDNRIPGRERLAEHWLWVRLQKRSSRLSKTTIKFRTRSPVGEGALKLHPGDIAPCPRFCCSVPGRRYFFKARNSKHRNRSFILATWATTNFGKPFAKGASSFSRNFRRLPARKLRSNCRYPPTRIASLVAS